MNQRGFVLSAIWEYVAVAAVVAVYTGFVFYQGGEAPRAERDAVQGKFDSFVAQTKALGEQQAEKAKAQDILNQQFKEQADAELAKAKTDLDAMYAKYRRVRNASAGTGAGSSTLPPAPLVTSSTPRTCFDSAKLAGAMGILETGVPEITKQGDVTRLKLSTAVDWATSLAKQLHTGGNSGTFRP